MLRRLAALEAEESYSLVGAAGALGVGDAAARVAALLIGSALVIAVVVFARRGDDFRSFTLALAAALAFTPIVWLHYLVLLLVPLAIARPRFSAVWLLPLLLWLTPLNGNGESIQPLLPALVAAIVVVLTLVEPEREPGTDSALPAVAPVSVHALPAARAAKAAALDRLGRGLRLAPVLRALRGPRRSSSPEEEGGRSGRRSSARRRPSSTARRPIPACDDPNLVDGSAYVYPPVIALLTIPVHARCRETRGAMLFAGILIAAVAGTLWLSASATGAATGWPSSGRRSSRRSTSRTSPSCSRSRRRSSGASVTDRLAAARASASRSPPSRSSGRSGSGCSSTRRLPRRRLDRRRGARARPRLVGGDRLRRSPSSTRCSPARAERRMRRMGLLGVRARARPRRGRHRRRGCSGSCWRSRCSPRLVVARAAATSAARSSLAVAGRHRVLPDRLAPLLRAAARRRRGRRATPRARAWFVPLLMWRRGGDHERNDVPDRPRRSSPPR